MAGIWDWVVDTMTKLTENMKEYKAKWFQEHKDDPEFRKKRQEASDRYHARKMAEDPEGFRETLRETNRKSMKKQYAKKRAAMTEEELEEYRRKTRERVAKYRERKKLEKAAQAVMRGE